MSIGFEILNLPHRADRKNVVIGNLITQGVPYENVTFHRAIYGADYQNREALCNEAIKDGFLIFASYNKPRGTLAYYWGLLRILRHIASDDYPFKFGYFNQDDRLLTINHFQLLQIAEKLFNRNGVNFLYLQLHWHTIKEDIYFRDKNVFKLHLDNQKRFGVYDGVPAIGDSGLIMTPSGAKHLLSQFTRDPETPSEVMISKAAVDGCYSTWNNSLITGIDYRWFGYTDWESEQDRITVNYMDT